MPAIFKTLVNIVIWILFIAGILGLIMGLVSVLKGGYGGFSAGTRAWGGAIVCLFLSVVCTWFRKQLD